MAAMTKLIGIIRTIIAKPAKMAGPKVNHRNIREMTICRGADQIMLKYGVRSMKRWASTDMRLTISPTVLVLRALLLSLRDLGGHKKRREDTNTYTYTYTYMYVRT